MSEEKRLKIGVLQGSGPPPGYFWSVAVIDFVFEEAIPILTEPGYEHMAMQVRGLAAQADPTHSDTVDIKPIEDFHEIRDGGSMFEGRNVRLFFGVDKGRKVIVPLGAISKQNNGPTPTGDKVRMRRRWRNYLRGDYGYLS